MTCPSCSAQAPEGVKFCGECGTQLRLVCHSCGVANPSNFKFCGECGAPIARVPVAAGARLPEAPAPVIATHAVVAAPTPVPAPASEAQRRQVTVMFVDLSGSTGLAEMLDIEDLRDMLRRYQEVAAGVISRFGGTIAKYIGDGMLVYFGYPVAHEDDAIRAAHAGLGILEGLRKLNEELERTMRLSLDIRIGIHTGLVVAGEMGAGDVREALAIVGETPNIAARIETTARLNTVTISDATQRLIEEAFLCRSVGSPTLKGVTRAIELFEIEAQRRFENLATDRPLIGRELELGILLDRWSQAQRGQGRVTLLSAEAGVGKSRLLQVFRERVATEEHTRLEARCSAYSQDSAFHPVIDMIEKELGFHTVVSAEDRLSTLETVVATLGLDAEEVVPPVAQLLSLPTGDRYAPMHLGPMRQKQVTLEALLHVLLALADRKPVLFVIEDLHWADPSTLELCELLIERGNSGPIYCVFTYRPQFQPPWPMRPSMSQIALDSLTATESDALVLAVAGKPLPMEVLAHIRSKADGVPLYIEQMTRALLESGILEDEDHAFRLIGSLDSIAIPTSLQDSLTARLDRLSTIKEVIQIGATLGREFSFALLAEVAQLDENTLKRELERLVDSDLLQQRGLPPRSRYIFKHALIQDAAYESLLKTRRVGYHERIAEVLVAKFPHIVETQPELVAHHYASARRVPDALEFWAQAGQRSIQRSAFAEAITHLKKALALLATVPESPETWGREIMLQTLMGIPLMMTRGYASAEMEQAYTRAHDLSLRLGNAPQMFPALYGMWLYYQVRCELAEAHETGLRLLAIAEAVGDSGLELEARAALGSTAMCRGDLTEARRHLSRGVELYNPIEHGHHAAMFGQDPGVVCGAHLAWTLWFMGEADAASQVMGQWLGHARAMEHFHSLAFALDFAAALETFARRPEQALAFANETIALSGEQGFPFWLAGGMTYAGWASGRLGRPGEGLERLAQGHDAWEMTGASLMRPCYLGLRAETLLASGQPADALAAIEEAIQSVEIGERWYEAELYRLKGQIVFALDGNEDQAMGCYQTAREIAQRQGASGFAQRAEALLKGEPPEDVVGVIQLR